MKIETVRFDNFDGGRGESDVHFVITKGRNERVALSVGGMPLPGIIMEKNELKTVLMCLITAIDSLPEI